MSLETSNSYELALVDELHFKVALTGWSGSPSIGYTRIGVPKLSVVKFHNSNYQNLMHYTPGLPIIRTSSF